MAERLPVETRTFEERKALKDPRYSAENPKDQIRPGPARETDCRGVVGQHDGHSYFEPDDGQRGQGQDPPRPRTGRSEMFTGLCSDFERRVHATIAAVSVVYAADDRVCEAIVADLPPLPDELANEAVKQFLVSGRALSPESAVFSSLRPPFRCRQVRVRLAT